MTNFTGFAIAGAQLGLQSILIKPKRGFYFIRLNDETFLPDIIADAVVEEKHHDELEVTSHPVQSGAAISDHAFKRPAEVVLTLGWSNSPVKSSSLVNAGIGAAAAVNPLARTVAGVASLGTAAQSVLSGAATNQINAIYKNLLLLQETRSLFILYTGKRTYTNMICKSLMTETTDKTANSMLVTMICQQIILVDTQTVSIPIATVKKHKNASKVSKGQVSTHVVGAA